MQHRERLKYKGIIMIEKSLKCAKCGSINFKNAKFCAECGNPLEELLDNTNNNRIVKTRIEVFEEESVLAKGLPSWTIEPPASFVRRR